MRSGSLLAVAFIGVLVVFGAMIAVELFPALQAARERQK